MDYDEDVFTDIKASVNYMMNDLRENARHFPIDMFKKKGRNAAKRLYNHYKRFLKENGIKIPFGFLERVYRCLFQYVYFSLRGYHRKRMILQDIAKSLNSLTWWEDWDSLVKHIRIKQVSKVEHHEKVDTMQQYRNLLMSSLKESEFLNNIGIKSDFDEFHPQDRGFQKIADHFQTAGWYKNK